MISVRFAVLLLTIVLVSGVVRGADTGASSPVSPVSPVWLVSPLPLQYTALGLGVLGTALVVVRPDPLFKTTYSSAIDDAVSFNISPTLYTIGDKGAQLMLLAPYVYYLGGRPSDSLAKSYVYTEALLLMHGTDTVGKYVVGRQRPEGGNRLSFPSGHSMQSFMVASWMGTDLLRTRGRTPLNYAYAGVLFGFAGFVGATRIGGKKHYFTDVVAGGVIGTAIGYGMYTFHFDENGNLRNPQRNRTNPSTLTILPLIDTTNGRYGLTATLTF